MSSIVMCDRCHRLGKSVALGGLTFKTQLNNKSVEARNFELCPGCVAELVAWLALPGKAGEADSGPPFTEPYTEPAEGEVEPVDSLSRAIGSRNDYHSSDHVDPWGEDR